MINKETNERKNLFNKLAPKYDFMNNIISLNTHKKVKKIAIENLDIKPNSKILDLCCGTGDMGKIIKSLYPTCDVIGVDFSEQMLDIARKNNKNITYRLMDATNLLFEKNEFDYVIMAFGLRNIKDKRKTLEEIYKILKKNGKFLHLDFGEQSYISRILDILILFLAKIFYKNVKPYKYLVLTKRNFPPPYVLVKIFEKIGFKELCTKNLIFNTVSFQIMTKE
jgi:demethylmenaquinone methyltransferase/2-methoxy-6-polyprenyl-1,4-benzoquinol methylase